MCMQDEYSKLYIYIYSYNLVKQLFEFIAFVKRGKTADSCLSCEMKISINARRQCSLRMQHTIYKIHPFLARGLIFCKV